MFKSKNGSNNDPKVRTKTRTNSAGQTMTKTVTRGKGYRKVEKNVTDQKGGYMNYVKERKKTKEGKSININYKKDREQPGQNLPDYKDVYTEGFYSKNKLNRKAAGTGPRKTVSSSKGMRYNVSGDDTTPGYTAYDEYHKRKEKGSKGKGKVSVNVTDQGYNDAGTRRLAPDVKVKTKGKASIVGRLKKNIRETGNSSAKNWRKK